jgi:tetratricopeptide (TPR) repeat protein
VVRRGSVLVLVLSAGLFTAVLAQNTPPGKGGPVATTAGGSDFELVEKLLVARRNYQTSLEQLHAHYLRTNDIERANWVKDEIKGFYLCPQHAYRLELEVPHPGLHGTTNIVEANRLYSEAMHYKDKGWNNDYILNQRRAEILFQKILTQYPQSYKISDTAYQLGDIYESKAFKHYKRAALYFERCAQWNPQTTHDARLRAARLYDRQLKDRTEALRMYREVKDHETDPRRKAEAEKRLVELAGTR